MIVQCPACSSRYRIRDDNIPPSGGKIRCPSCGHSFVVYPASASEADDSTSITDRNALNNLVNNMAGRSSEDAQSTEIVGGDDLDALRSMQGGADAMDDGTVEIKNPMEYWQNLKNIEVDEKIGGAPSAYVGGGDDQSEAEYDAAETEIVSPDNLNLPFAPGGAKPTIPAPTGRSKPSLPKPGAPGSHGGPTVPPPNTGARNGPAIPPPRPTQDTPDSAPHTAPPLRPAQQGPPGLPSNQQDDPFAPPASAGQQQAGQQQAGQQRPGQQMGGQPEQVRQGVPADSASNAFGDADSMAPDPMSGFGGGTDPFRPSGSSSEDIMAAIEEASQAHVVDESPAWGGPDGADAAKPDPTHEGPWKLKTNFGLTYEFPDNRSLRNWLSSRDELDGYSLSGDGTNFFALSEFPQISKGGAGVSQSIASSGLNPQPQNLPSMPGSDQSGDRPPSGAQQPAAGFGQTPPPGGFSQPPSRGLGSGRFQPLPDNPGAPVQGAPVSNEFQPPSREAKYNGLLWLIFLVLLAICVVVGLQTFEVYDFMALISDEESDSSQVTQPQRDEGTAEEKLAQIEPAGDDDDVVALLKEARREVRENRLQSALDRIKTVQMLEPDNIEALEISIEAHGKLGQAEKVEELEARVAELQGAETGPDAGAAEEEPPEDSK